MKKRIFCALFIIILIFTFVGCTGKNGSIYGQRSVLRYVDSVCPEPYKLLEKELTETDPDRMVYYFQTRNRDLSFEAESYLSPIWIDATQTSFYYKEISCNYVNAVHDQYRAELEEVLSKSPNYLEEKQWMYLTSFADIDHVVEMILAADRVYVKEQEYNSSEFLKKNPLASIHLIWCRSHEEARDGKSWNNITDIDITGQNTKEELYEKLADRYAQMFRDGEIEKGEDIPAAYLRDKHVSVLETIALNDQEMLYDGKENPYGPYVLTTDDYKYCWYNQQQGTYMMVIDIGRTYDNMSFPLIIREYVEALGGTYAAKEKAGVSVSQWKIGNDTWVMRSEYSGNEIRKLEIKKNGQALDISYLTVDEDHNVRASFCVGVPVTDFCRLFDLTCEIDEANGKIAFEQGGET